MALLNYHNTVSLKEILFGLELEGFMTSKREAIKAIGEVLGTSHYDRTDHLNGYEIIDAFDRSWKVVSDSSIDPDYGYGCEFVTPVLNTSDMGLLETIIEKLKSKGFAVNGSCGIHVHVDHRLVDHKALIKVLQHSFSREDMIYMSLGTTRERQTEWCRPASEKLARFAKKTKDAFELEACWYDGNMNPSKYTPEGRDEHYDGSRYHGTNLHSYFEGKGIEYRYFESTTDWDLIKAYIELCQGLLRDAINSVDMVQYLHIDRTIYSKPDRAAQLWETYLDRMGITGKSKRLLLEKI